MAGDRLSDGQMSSSSPAQKSNEQDSPIPPDENSNSNNEEYGDDIDDESDFDALDRQLDQLNDYLDLLEQKNDMLTAQLRELLESSRQARIELNQLHKTAAKQNDSGECSGSNNTNNDDGGDKKDEN